tara:strand:- start:4018 stop:4233 length:216 start_codon:yes stop_codon:yes gene_type:complete
METDMIKSFKNLDELLTAMRANAFTDREMSSLPTFGGTEPSDTAEVWSWDETRLIVGTDLLNFEIVNRDDF